MTEHCRAKIGKQGELGPSETKRAGFFTLERNQPEA